MKPPRSWQEKQWYPEENHNIDLSSRLQALESQKYPQLMDWQAKSKAIFWKSFKIICLVGLVAIIGRGVMSNISFPWHWQLFGHWLLRKGELREIPVTLHQELNQLCFNADHNGQVDGYQGSREIAYGLGRFQCLPTPDDQGWIIRDRYAFDNTDEALAGTLLAESLILLWGKDYAYDIRITIPKIRPDWQMMEL